jgi:predicted secreted protein
MTQPPPPGYPGNPGYPGYPSQPPPAQAPSNYLVWSILVTLFCCLPLGIVAIVKSSQVNGLWAQGQYAEAQAAAATAKKIVIWTVVAGVVINLIWVGLFLAGFLNAAAHDHSSVIVGFV